MEAPRTLLEAISVFSDLKNCYDYLIAKRWPNGVVCLHCGSLEVGKLCMPRGVWNCKSCKKQFSIKYKTIFERSPLSLSKWLSAVWLVVNAKNGISSCEMARALGVTQKTAWFMGHRIRLALHSGGFEMSGQVEADETYIGGKARFMHKGRRKVTGRGTVGKTVVMGLLERNTDSEAAKLSRVILSVVADTTRPTLQAAVRKYVLRGSHVFTDELRSYIGLDADYVHNVINHAECYAKGQVHTNGLENFWSLLKRGIRGTYVSVETFHLFRYLDEQAYRFNERLGDDSARFGKSASMIEGKRLTYSRLTGCESAPS